MCTHRVTKDNTFTVDIRCNDLLVPNNGEIMSCSSGRVGVGYEGDTCSFTCNTGYELTGSDTWTCQSDGSWSGTDTMCREGQNAISIIQCYVSVKFLYIYSNYNYIQY